VIFPGFNLYLDHPSIFGMESTLTLFSKLLYVPSNPWFVRGMKSDCVHWKKFSIAMFRSLVKDDANSSDDGLSPSPLNHSFLVDHKPKPFKPDWGYRRTDRSVHILLLSLQMSFGIHMITLWSDVPSGAEISGVL
jgi:hypothetical protein